MLFRRFLTLSLLLAVVIPLQADEEQSAAATELSPQARSVADRAVALEEPADLDTLIEAIGDRPHVLLGEASHGTHEYYTWRTEISRRLIEEKGFRFISVEGDWANAWEVNRYVKDLPGAAETAREALAAFDRWPEWMWNNREVLELVEWMREHNADLEPQERVGFYGIDLYTPWQSMQQAEEAVAQWNSEEAEQLGALFDCLRRFRDGNAYAQGLAWGQDSCELSIVQAAEHIAGLEELREEDEKLFLSAKQNVQVVRNAERHYRGMVDQQIDSWNARAQHFFETYDRLIRFSGDDAKGIVWAHNTHIGDARQTIMTAQGQVNIGQLAREAYDAENVFAVGFGTFKGAVVAGTQWDSPLQVMEVPEAPSNSLEYVLRSVSDEPFYFLTTTPALEPEGFWFQPVPHRAIGVVYNPARENPGNYVPTIFPRRYDAFIFLPETKGLDPL